MITIARQTSLEDLKNPLNRLFELAIRKNHAIRKNRNEQDSAPVFTIDGKYSSRTWTEWTQGFMYGSALLTFEATGHKECLEWARSQTVKHMAAHLNHFGVHDHGFNNMSTYGNLLRLMKNGLLDFNIWEKNFYELALKSSGACQSRRFITLPHQLGYISSFNGAHSLFADTIRSMRILAVSHQLGHFFWGEQDKKINLLKILLQHAETTAQYNVYFGENRDMYDTRGRVAHESVFNAESGSYRCPASQQGYSPFSTWTRAQAWILTGFTELLEFIASCKDNEIKNLNLPFYPNKQTVIKRFGQVAQAVADNIISQSPVNGIPYWDTGAPLLHKIGDYKNMPAQPYNDFEPVDSSAAAISVQGLFRLANHIKKSNPENAAKYNGAAITIMQTLLSDDYLSLGENHEGLLLHSIYHRPKGWDHIKENQKIPNGESSMWGDYHILEVGIYLLNYINKKNYHTFFDI